MRPEDVHIHRRDDYDLEFHIVGTSDTLLVKNYFGYYRRGTIERVNFADGTVWKLPELLEKARHVNGTDGDDMLYGYSDQDDILNGGKGNDRIEGRYGDDTYQFAKGDGADTIYDYRGNDTLTTDRLAQQVIFERRGNDLRVLFENSSDSITISKRYSKLNTAIETFQAADGSTISDTQVQQLIQAMASWSNDNGGLSWSQALATNPGDVQAIVAQYWHAPTA
ncbi:hypothetical protein CR983_00285 [Candidatus Saccharibacteria bacterium]|nr:MAG: hypothetical protein CR983_00285 [Candidatus Saccharibacteria bacterium]